jgi:hypothetical protein
MLQIAGSLTANAYIRFDVSTATPTRCSFLEVTTHSKYVPLQP